MKQHFRLMLLACMLSILVLPALSHGLQAQENVRWNISEATRTQGQQVVTIELEGQQEEILVTCYEGSNHPFALWYDERSFNPVPIEHGVQLTLENNMLNALVKFTIRNTDRQQDGLKPDIAALQQGYEQDGWVCEHLDAAGLLPGFQLPGQLPQAFIAHRNEQITRVFLTQAASGQYLITLTYPQEAAEGWGARMLMMMNTLESLPTD